MLVKFESNGNCFLEKADAQQQQDPGCEEAAVPVNASTNYSTGNNLDLSFPNSLKEFYSFILKEL